jgi:hypothetical protein
LIDGNDAIRSSATIRCFDRQFVEVDIDRIRDGDDVIQSSATNRCFDRQFVGIDIDRIKIEKVREI